MDHSRPIIALDLCLPHYAHIFVYIFDVGLILSLDHMMSHLRSATYLTTLKLYN